MRVMSVRDYWERIPLVTKLTWSYKITYTFGVLWLFSTLMFLFDIESYMIPVPLLVTSQVHMVGLLSVALVTVVFHEIVHAVVAKYYGVLRDFNPLPTPIPKIAIDASLPDRQYLIIAVAPIVVITLVYSLIILTLPPSFLTRVVFFALFINLLGANGDVANALLVVTRKLVKLSPRP